MTRCPRSPRSLALSILIALAAPIAAGCPRSDRPFANFPSAQPAPKGPALSTIPEEPVARVGAREITNQQLFTRLDKRGEHSAEQRVRAALDRRVAEILLANEGARLGLTGEPGVVAAADKARRRVAARLYHQQLTESVDVDEAILRRLYHGSDTVDYDAIVAANQADAQALLDRLRGGAELSEQARYSLDPAGAKAGGAMGTRARRDLDGALADTLFSCELEQFVGPIETQLGWVVARVHARHIGDDAGFEAKREALAEFARRILTDQMKQHLLQKLWAEAGAAIDEPFLRGTGTRLKATDDELDHVVAAVYGTPVRYRDVVQAVKDVSRGMEGGHLSGPGLKISFAKRLVNQLLIEHAALDRGLGDRPEARAAAGQAERVALVEAVKAKLQTEAAPVTPVQVRAYYDAHPEEFHRPARRRVAHIVVRARDAAAAIVAKVRSGGDYAEIARDESIDGASSARGGVIGVMSDANLDVIAARGEPGLAKAIKTLPPGAVSDPIHSRDGWHVLRISDYQPEGPAPFAQVRPSIAAQLATARGDRAIARRVAQLRAAATVTIDEPALARAAAAVKDSEPTP